MEKFSNEKNQSLKNSKVFKGACLCGSVRFNLKGELRNVINCHCGQCLHTHGHYAAYTAVEKEKLELIIDDGLKWYRSSKDARRGFCKKCGASIFFERIDGNKISISAGMLVLSEGIKTSEHIFFDLKPSYYEINDSLPKFSQYYLKKL